MATGCGPPQDVSPQTQAFPVFTEKHVKKNTFTTNLTSQTDIKLVNQT